MPGRSRPTIECLTRARPGGTSCRLPLSTPLNGRFTAPRVGLGGSRGHGQWILGGGFGGGGGGCIGLLEESGK